MGKKQKSRWQPGREGDSIPDFGRGPCKRAENRVPRPVQNAPAARKQKTEAAQRVTRRGPKTRKQLTKAKPENTH